MSAFYIADEESASCLHKEKNEMSIKKAALAEHSVG